MRKISNLCELDFLAVNNASCCQNNLGRLMCSEGEGGTPGQTKLSLSRGHLPIDVLQVLFNCPDKAEVCTDELLTLLVLELGSVA